ncbi:MAG: iron-sulfur cluster assembly accessory protein [Firmicutes bacterium]|nr:iron-sulfur cluster assembly accessory protein [Bacillota bacterium]
MAITLEITEAAQKAFQELGEHAEIPYIRVTAGEACSCGRIGYQMYWEDEIQPTDDRFETGGVTLVVDDESLPYVDGSVIDYHQDPMQSGFLIQNPNVNTGCSCG